MNDCISLMIVTGVIYDYVLTFSKEVHYVWLRPWTWVSTIFVLVRYAGLCGAILIGLDGSTFVPGPVVICTAVSLVSDWEFAIFLAAADLVMILRVFAMWTQSKWIFYSLLFIYVPEAIVSLIFTGIYNNPNTYLSALFSPVSIVQVVDFSICKSSTNKSISLIHLYVSIPRLILGVILFILALIPALKDAVGMYKATKQWQSNKYLKQLMKDGIFYFLMNVLLTAYRILKSQLDGTNISLRFLTAFCYMIVFPMMPRFIISIRELYDRDLRRLWQGVDTGFGVFSQPSPSENATISVIVFTDVAPGQGRGQVVDDGEASEEIRLDVLGDGTRQV